MFMTIFSGIVTIAAAVPAVKEMIERFIELYTKKQLADFDATIMEAKEKRYALIQSIKKASSNNERKALSVMLNDLYRVMPNESGHKEDGALSE